MNVEQIVNAHRPVVLSVANRFARQLSFENVRRGIDRDDLIQEGMMALVQCAAHYQDHRDSFVGWCRGYITHKVKDYIAANTTPVTTVRGGDPVYLTPAYNIQGDYPFDQLTAPPRPPLFDWDKLRVYMTAEELNLLLRYYRGDGMRVLAAERGVSKSKIQRQIADLLDLARCVFGQEDSNVQ